MGRPNQWRRWWEMGEVEESIAQSRLDLAWKMHYAVVLWRLESCRVTQLRRHVADSIWSGLVKSRPAHLKPMTVPRLEVSAAVSASLFERNWTFWLHNQHIGQTPPACCSTSEISLRDFTRLLQTEFQLFTRTQPTTSGDTHKFWAKPGWWS